MPRMIIAAKSVSCRKGVISMAKVIRVRTTTHVRRVGTGTYQVRTTISNGKSTKTSTKTVRVRWVQHKILKEGEDWMAKNSRQTSKRVASIASKVLRDNRFSDSAKSAAASALAQAPKSKKKWILLYQLSRRFLLLSIFLVCWYNKTRGERGTHMTRSPTYGLSLFHPTVSVLFCMTQQIEERKGRDTD